LSTAQRPQNSYRNGETTWFEGLLLVGVYVLFGLSFSSPAPPDGWHARMRDASVDTNRNRMLALIAPGWQLPELGRLRHPLAENCG
jgi:hypothetical protein